MVLSKSFKGEILNVNMQLINHCFRTNQIPIINSFGESMNSNEYLCLDSNHVTNLLAANLKPFKIINLNPVGGIKDSNGKVNI